MIFLDTNILLDVLLSGREEWKLASTEVVDRVRTGREKGCLSALSVPTVWYAMGERRESIKEIKSIIKHFKIISLNSFILGLSFKTDINDFEDAIQLNSALASKSDYLITRNKRDFEPVKGIAILTPEEFLAKHT